VLRLPGGWSPSFGPSHNLGVRRRPFFVRILRQFECHHGRGRRQRPSLVRASNSAATHVDRTRRIIGLISVTGDSAVSCSGRAAHGRLPKLRRGHHANDTIQIAKTPAAELRNARWTTCPWRASASPLDGRAQEAGARTCRRRARSLAMGGGAQAFPTVGGGRQMAFARLANVKA